MFVLGFLLAVNTLIGPPKEAPPPTAVRIVVEKAAHKMTLYGPAAKDATPGIIASYRVAIGPGGKGPKMREGDSVTPIGRYHIVYKKPSQYRVFMLLDYPNAEDRARFERAKASGIIPKTARIGGSVGIHGAPPQEEWKARHKEVDWTLGCVAVDDAEVEAIAKMVPDGTPVDIVD